MFIFEKTIINLFKLQAISLFGHEGIKRSNKLIKFSKLLLFK